jgi:EAL domain-containing protein (putative c-di-GMP-specific phosphodiesterase class I)
LCSTGPAGSIAYRVLAVMPLTSVVSYLDQRLRELHPRAQLSARTRLRLHGHRVWGRMAEYRLVPRQVPVLAAATGAVFAWRAKLVVESESGHRTLPESLYVHAWDEDDVVFIDRFLRTLHALHHLSLGAGREGRLALDVHLRHVAALREQHGRVFESLLHRLGLTPERILIRLSGRALQEDPHVRNAALSFARGGYGLVAARLDIADSDWELLRSLGIRWIAPDADTLQRARATDWATRAKARGIGLWLDAIDSAEAIVRARRLGAYAIEGALCEPRHRSNRSLGPDSRVAEAP